MRCCRSVLRVSVVVVVAVVVVFAGKAPTTTQTPLAYVAILPAPKLWPNCVRRKAKSSSSRSITTTKLTVVSDDNELAYDDDDGSDGGQDLMDAFLAEAAQRLTSSTSTVDTPQDLHKLQQRRSMEFVSPASIGGWKPQTPSFLLSSDYVVQHLMEGLATLAPREEEDHEGEYEESQYEEDEKEALRQCFLFTSLDSDAGKWDANFRVSWAEEQGANKRGRYERVLLHGPNEFMRDLKRHFPFLISGQWQDFCLLGIPQFNNDETECSVDVRIMPQGRIYRFSLSRPELLQAERVTHQDCWLVSNVEELSAEKYGSGGGSCSI